MPPFVYDDTGPWPLGRFPGLDGVPRVAHGVTTRDGPRFGTVAAAPLTAEAAAATARALGLDGAAFAHQVHGGDVIHATGPGLLGDADALVTDTPGLAVLARSADCPLILAVGVRGDGTPAVGVAHASWRSTVRGITAAMLARLREDLGVDPATVAAAMGPSAGPCCYEVGDEVREDAIGRLGPGAGRYFLRVGDRWRFDLWTANLSQLIGAGVPAARITGSGVCTICQGERFWSWRAQGEAADRFAAAIGIRPAG
jgi:YfiH family protein